MTALPTIALARQVGSLPPNIRLWLLRSRFDAFGFVRRARRIGGAA